MITLNPKYITDNNGRKLSAILSIEEYRSLIEYLEDLEDIRLYDEAKKDNELSVPINEAFNEIEAKRNEK